VDACVLSTETGWLKPHPVAYREAQRRLGLAASELVMVGDDWEFDVQVPQRLGMRAIWRRPPGAALPDDVVPDAVIDRLGDLLPAIAAQDAEDRVA
jgi:putative hydrolase of the HAD superfamily